MRNIIIIIFILFTSNIFGHRENTYYLKGHIGAKEVGLRMDEFGDKCFVRYFNITDKKDHLLEGSITDNNSYLLHSFEWDSLRMERKIIAELRIQETQNHDWEGFWNLMDEPKQKVSLHPIIIDSIHHPYHQGISEFTELQINPYAAYRTIDVSFTNLKQQKIGKDMKIQWVLEPRSGIQHFRIISSKKENMNIETINRFLAAEHIKLVDSKLSCISSGETNHYSSEIKVHFLNSFCVSYTLKTNSSCMGMSNEIITTHFTRSMATAKKIMLEDIIWFGDYIKPEMREGGQSWYQYRYKVFGEKTLSLLMDLYPKKFSREQGASNDNNVKSWQFPIWYFTTKGLYVGSKSVFAKSNGDHSNWSVIPWKSLQPYIIGFSEK